MLKYNVDEFYSLAQKSTKTVKSIDPHKRLVYLNGLIDMKLGRALQVLENAKFIKKCSIAFIGTTHADGTRDLNQHYGHICIDDEKYYRVSTCLDKQHMTIQIPSYESQYWDENTYLCFTTGDLFLTVKALDLNGCLRTKTDIGNDEFYILELLQKKVVRHFGIIDDVNLMESTVSDCDLKKVNLLDGFNDFKIKGCLSSQHPKYALKYAHSNDVEYFASLEGIRKVYPSLRYSRQYLSSISKKNISEKFDEPKEITIDGIDYILYNIKGITIDDFIKMLPTEYKDELILYDDSIELTIKEAEDFIKSISSITVSEFDITNIKNLFGKVTKATCNEAVELGQIRCYG